MPKTPAPPWNTSVESFMRFQESALSRAAGYFLEVGDLARTGTLEPAAWIDPYARFLSGLVADVGTWMGAPARGHREFRLKRHRLLVRPNDRTRSIRIPVPDGAFGADPGSRRTIGLVLSELVQKDGGAPFPAGSAVLTPVSAKWTDPARSVRLRLGALNDAGLRPGAVYRGIIWANETDVPVAAIEVEVVKPG